MKAITSLSYSALSQYGECPEKFRRTRMLGARVDWDDTQETVRGKLIHKFLERMVHFRIRKGRWPKLNVARAHMAKVWTNGFEERGQNVLNAVDWDPKFREKSEEDSLTAIPLLYNEVFGSLDPIAAEQFVEIELPRPGKYIKYLRGFMDVVANPNFIIDWKVRKSPANDRWLDFDLQATVYAALSGMDKVNVNFVQIVMPKTKGPRVAVGHTERDARHVDWLLNEMIPETIKSIEGGPMPATPGWFCSNCPVPCGARPDLEVKV